MQGSLVSINVVLPEGFAIINPSIYTLVGMWINVLPEDVSAGL